MVLPLGVTQAAVSEAGRPSRHLYSCAPSSGCRLTKSKTFVGDCASSARRHLQFTPATVEQNSQFRGLTSPWARQFAAGESRDVRYVKKKKI